MNRRCRDFHGPNKASCAIVWLVSRVVKSSNQESPAPTVSFKEEVAGRETLAAIAESQAEAFFPHAHRAPSSTKHYGDRISNAPGAVSPRVARALDQAPEITVSMGIAGRETLAALNQDSSDAPPEIEITGGELPAQELDVGELEIEQMHSFVIQADANQLSDPKVQRHLIDQRLLQRMPGCSLGDVTDVVVKPWGDGTVLVRVSTRVG